MSGVKMLLLAVFCFFSLCEGDQLGCMGYNPMADVDNELLKGKWYEYQTYSTFNLIDPSDHDCLVANFYPEVHALTIMEDFIRRVPGINNKEHTRREWKISRPPTQQKGLYYGVTRADNGLLVSFTYSVVKTDYNNWLLAAICGGDKFRGVYVMTRDKDLNVYQVSQVEKNLREVIKRYDNDNVQRYEYTTKRHDECKDVVFPERLYELPMF